jgi:hypothetical protein
MREVLPGVFHWTTLHPSIHTDVSSYWLDRAGVAIDPLVPRSMGSATTHLSHGLRQAPAGPGRTQPVRRLRKCLL